MEIFCSRFFPKLWLQRAKISRCTFRENNVQQFQNNFLQDRDSSVRDATVEALGTISTRVHSPEGKDLFSCFLKPLYKLLSEQVLRGWDCICNFYKQNKSIQSGAALSIASILRQGPPEEVIAQTEKVISGFQKHLSQPSCLSKASVYVAFASLAEVGYLILDARMFLNFIDLWNACYAIYSDHLATFG